MYLSDAIGAIFRRWYIVLLGILCLVGGAYLTTKDIPTQYQSNGQVLLLLPPTSTGSATPTNPYLNAPAGLTTLASLISTEESTTDSVRELAGGGFNAKYSVSVLPGAGPVIAVTAKGTDPADVVATRDEVIRRLGDDLLKMQSETDFPANQLVYSRASGDVGAEVLHGSKRRALIGLGGASAMATLILVALLERLRGWVARRRAAAGPPRVGASPDQEAGRGAGHPRQPDLVGSRVLGR